MSTHARRLVDVADTLRRAHAALGEAVAMLRKVSLRGGERRENRHRLRLAAAQVYEARYRLAAARSELAVGLHLEEPELAPPLLEPAAQVLAARQAISRLLRIRAKVVAELEAVSVRADEPGLAQLDDQLPAERVALPVAELALAASVVGALVGVAALLLGHPVVGGLAVLGGAGAWVVAARGGPRA